MEELATNYGTTREAIVTVADAAGNEVTIKIPNAKSDLASDSSVVSTLTNYILSDPETEDDYRLILVKGQVPTKVTIDVVTTTKTLITSV